MYVLISSQVVRPFFNVEPKTIENQHSFLKVEDTLKVGDEN